MYTYKLGGMLITDELYHDDLEAMTFGRKDQNELKHHGIKGQSWGKRRFQNEDGSLTMAGRNRYDVGDPRQGVTAYSDTGGRGGSGVNYNRLPGTGGSTRSATANQAPARLVGSNPKGRANTSTAATKQKVASTANAGRKAADNLFGRIGNWASNAAKDVGNFATNTYNDASKAVTNVANDVGRAATNAYNDASKWVEDRAKDVGNAVTNTAANLSNTPEYRDTANAVNDAKNWAGNAANDVSKTAQNAAKDAGNWLGNAFNDAKNWVGDRAQDVGRAATNAYNDASKAVTGAANDVGNFVNDNYNRAREAVNGAAGDIGRTASNAFNDAKNWAGNAANDVSNFVKNAPQNISDWYTGDKAGREAQRYDNVVQNFERNAERNIDSGIDKMIDSDKWPSSAYDLETNQKMRDKAFNEGLKQRNLGYKQDDIAAQYGWKADKAQAQYDAAPRQLLERAGNWVGDRVSDVGNALKPGVDAVGNALRDAGNWVGDTAKNVYNDVDYRLYSLGQDIAQPAKDRAYQDFLDRTAKDRETFNREFPTGDMTAARYADANINNEFGKYQKETNRIRQNPIGSAINNVGRSIGEGVQKAGDWASNAASDVRDWGAGALDKGRQAFESLFGRSEAPKAELSDPNSKVIPENIIREQIIPEQRITENRIEEQRVPEAIVREGEKYAQMTPDQRQARMDSQKNRPTVNGSNNVQTWDNANINTWDNVQTFGDPDMVNTIKMLNDNGFFNRGGSSNSGNNSSMSDKPSNVSDEYWRDYTSNGGTRDSYDRQMQARQNSQNNQNSSTSRQDVVGTVDTSRPYHFTYDPASGQTIVVYDDEKRR